MPKKDNFNANPSKSVDAQKNKHKNSIPEKLERIVERNAPSSIGKKNGDPSNSIGPKKPSS